MGVFVSGADLDAVDAVALTPSHDDALDTVAELVDAGLVNVVDDPGGEPRVVMLQTVADYALDQLTATGELDDARARHAQHYLHLGETLLPSLFTGRALATRQRLQAEDDNFRAALNWSLQPDSGESIPPQQARWGLRLCATLTQFWMLDRFAPELRRWCERALEVDSGVDSRERATVLRTLSDLYDDWPPDDPRRREPLDESLAISRRIDDTAGIIESLIALSWERMYAEDFETAATLAEQAAMSAAQIPDAVLLSESLHMRGHVEVWRGNPSLAVEFFTESQALSRERGNEVAVAAAETDIAASLTAAGRVEEAADRLRQVIADVLRISHPALSINALGVGAHICAAQGHHERAAILLGANWAHLAKTGLKIEPLAEEAEMRQFGLDTVRDQLGPERWDKALRVGRTMSLEDALALAVQT